MTESNLSFAPLPNGLCRGERRGGMEEEMEEEEVEREEGAPTVQQLHPPNINSHFQATVGRMIEASEWWLRSFISVEVSYQFSPLFSSYAGCWLAPSRYSNVTNRSEFPCRGELTPLVVS